MCAKALKGPSLARSVPKPLKGPSLARSVLKPLKEPSLARSVLKPFKMGQEGQGEGEGAKRRYTLCHETLLLFAVAALYFVPRDSLTLRCRPPTPLVTGNHPFTSNIVTWVSSYCSCELL